MLIIKINKKFKKKKRLGNEGEGFKMAMNGLDGGFFKFFYLI
jgi:hypothetical protein